MRRLNYCPVGSQYATFHCHFIQLQSKRDRPMHGTWKLPDLIEEIYDAALEPALWNDVVVRINDFVGGQACGLISKDTMSQFGLTHYYCGVDPHYIQLYSETYSRFDPLTTLPP